MAAPRSLEWANASRTQTFLGPTHFQFLKPILAKHCGDLGAQIGDDVETDFYNKAICILNNVSASLEMHN